MKNMLCDAVTQSTTNSEITISVTPDHTLSKMIQIFLPNHYCLSGAERKSHHADVCSLDQPVR